MWARMGQGRDPIRLVRTGPLSLVRTSELVWSEPDPSAHAPEPPRHAAASEAPQPTPADHAAPSARHRAARPHRPSPFSAPARPPYSLGRAQMAHVQPAWLGDFHAPAS